MTEILNADDYTMASLALMQEVPESQMPFVRILKVERGDDDERSIVMVVYLDPVTKMEKTVFMRFPKSHLDGALEEARAAFGRGIKGALN